MSKNNMKLVLQEKVAKTVTSGNLHFYNLSIFELNSGGSWTEIECSLYIITGMNDFDEISVRKIQFL